MSRESAIKLLESWVAEEKAQEAYIKKLEAVVAAANGLMSEDDAVEAVSHFNCLFILMDALKSLEQSDDR